MAIGEEMLALAAAARQASRKMADLSSAVKNELLLGMADALQENTAFLQAENAKDLQQARENNMAPAMVDRLTLDDRRIADMADGLREVAALPDPVGEITGMWLRPNGIRVGRQRIPLGVIGIIYESRPNVTADAAGLCLKSGNAVILRGGSEALHSNPGDRNGPATADERAGSATGSSAGRHHQRPQRGDRTAQARGPYRSDHPARRRRPDPFRLRTFTHSGHQTLQGRLPYLCRCPGPTWPWPRRSA